MDQELTRSIGDYPHETFTPTPCKTNNVTNPQNDRN